MNEEWKFLAENQNNISIDFPCISVICEVSRREVYKKCAVLKVTQMHTSKPKNYCVNISVLAVIYESN